MPTLNEYQNAQGGDVDGDWLALEQEAEMEQLFIELQDFLNSDLQMAGFRVVNGGKGGQ